MQRIFLQTPSPNFRYLKLPTATLDGVRSKRPRVETSSTLLTSSIAIIICLFCAVCSVLHVVTLPNCFCGILVRALHAILYRFLMSKSKRFVHIVNLACFK